MTEPIVWAGEQAFRIAGTDLHEDTLRIRSRHGHAEDLYRLRLPTLCITYADMRFANDIGGRQLRWPDSAEYGPRYFDPPLVIDGSREVERLTWIRGAQRVVIGPRETEIEWFSPHDVVVPRFRISSVEPVEALLHVEKAVVRVDAPLHIDITQYADGRPVGGLSVVKRHPEWHEPTHERPTYRLWLRVVDMDAQHPMAEARVSLLQWRPEHTGGAFEVVEDAWTDGTGSLVREGRPAGALEAATLAQEGWRATAKVWRAEPNQPMNLLMTASRLRRATYRGRTVTRRAIYAADYVLDPGDTLEWLADAFRYRSVSELKGGRRIRSEVAQGHIQLPGWYFIQARPGDTLERIAAEFDLPAGWPRTTGRHHRPDRTTLLEHEVVAVPDPRFAEGRDPW